MSTLLAFAIVVLVVVGGLGLWQRRTRPQPTAGRASTAAGAAADTGLDVRARAGILTDARERGRVVPDTGPAVQPNQLSIGIDGDRVFRGYVWYRSDGPDGEFGVSSTDKWRTLTLQVIG